MGILADPLFDDQAVRKRRILQKKAFLFKLRICIRESCCTWYITWRYISSFLKASCKYNVFKPKANAPLIQRLLSNSAIKTLQIIRNVFLINTLASLLAFCFTDHPYLIFCLYWQLCVVTETIDDAFNLNFRLGCVAEQVGRLQTILPLTQVDE